MASFNKYLPLLHEVEGGFQKLPTDNGNYNSLGQLVGTNYGISARFYEDVIGRPPTEADMRSITRNKADNIFKIYFWNKAQGNKIKSQSVAETIVDHQINAGSGVKLAQGVLKDDFGKPLVLDGIMGNKTLSALNSVNPKQFVDRFNAKRISYYQSLGGSFVGVWINRVAKFAYKNQIAISSTLVVGALAIAYVFSLKS